MNVGSFRDYTISFLVRVSLIAAMVMVAFAANSVIARLAFVDHEIDPGTFTLLRVISGACALSVITLLSSRGRHFIRGIRGSWLSAAFLLVYAVAFSYAYVEIGAATGALVLFGVVQAVTFTAAYKAEERPGAAGLIGLALALAGLVALVGPSVSRPNSFGTLLMAIAGASWAIYTLRGRKGNLPVLETAGNFIRCAPMALMLWLTVLLFNTTAVHISPRGIGLAILSGAITSGVGYALWYTVLPSLTRVQSGIIQMAPAPLATIGGLTLIGEPITERIVLASILILSGVLIGVMQRRKVVID